MCKSDILKAFGYHVNVTSRRRAQFSAPSDDQHVVHVTADNDHISADATSTNSESNAYPFPVVSEIHDPFSFTPSTSPQLVQVLNTSNARGFSIIPLTVHNPNSGPIINGAVERHPITLPATSFNTGKSKNLLLFKSNKRNFSGESGSVSAGPTASGSRLLRSAAHSTGQRKNRGHIVSLVHVRSRSLSHATLPSLPNQTNVEIEHHDRPTALFRTSPSEEQEHPNEVPRVPSPAPEPTSPPSNEPTKMQNFVGDFTPDVVVKKDETSESSGGSIKQSRPSTMSSVSNNTKRVPSPARQSNSSSIYSAFHVVPSTQPTNNQRSTSQTVPFSDAISVESL